MATKLKNLKVTSVDLVPAGANPDAHVRLFKSKDKPEESSQPTIPAKPASNNPFKKMLAAIAKMMGMPDEQIEKAAGDAETFGDAFADRIAQEQCRAACDEVWDMVMALQSSLCSILQDSDLDSDSKASTMQQSVSEFNTAISEAVDSWAAGTPTGKVQKKAMTEDTVAMLKSQQARIEELLKAAASESPETPNDEDGKPKKKPEPQSTETSTKKGVMDSMKIDKSKMTPEEVTQLEAFEKKYGTPDGAPEGTPPEGGAHEGSEPQGGVEKINPEVKKALEEVEALKKSLQLQQETSVAKKYEILGKKPEDVAKKLVDLKKAGGTAYDDYVALLDEQVDMFQKSGLFKETGSNAPDGGGSSWDKVNKAADEIMKGDTSISRPAAIEKACAQHPELLDEYEKSYNGR